jgi:hypothetical protein
MAVTTLKKADKSESLADSTGVTNPLVLLKTAIERGVEPAQLEKLLDLQERFERNRARQEWADAMAECQNEMPAVIKDADNKQTNSKYAKLETVNITVKPIYTRHGFSVSFGTEPSTIERHIRVYIDVRHGIHSERTAADFPLDDSGAKGTINKTGMHATGSTLSYARRYLLLLAFNITVANEDNDAMRRADECLISQEQSDVLVKMIVDKGVDMARFLKWAEVERIEDMTAGGYAKAMDFLRRRNKTEGATA